MPATSTMTTLISDTGGVVVSSLVAFLPSILAVVIPLTLMWVGIHWVLRHIRG